MSETIHDLAIVGSGSAAFAAAIRAADLGADVVMVERGTLGGTCVNVGCIPSKALIAAAHARHQAAQNRFAGIVTSADGVDLAALIGAKDALVAAMRRQKYADLIDEYGFTLRRGTASFVDAETIAVDGTPLRAERYLLATGARPAVPAIRALAKAGYLTSTTALDVTELPRRIVVVGGNYIGLELAQLLARLGVEVTLLEALDRIAPFEEPEAGDALTRALSGEGIEIVAGALVERVEADRSAKRVVARVGDEEVLFLADEILIATGRRPNSDLLALERAGIATDERGFIAVDPSLQTSNGSVFAAGDVTGAPQFVYVAARMGALAADNALNDQRREIDYTALPRITFTSPQIAAVGLTEAQAQAAGFAVQTSTLPVEHVPRAIVGRQTDGVFKLVVDADTERLLGATVVGEGAGDVILAAVYAVKFGLTAAQISETWAPYLTMSEGFKLAAQTFERDVAHLSCCAV